MEQGNTSSAKPHLFAGRSFTRVEGGVFEPVAVSQVGMVEKERVGTQLCQSLEAVIDEGGGGAVEHIRLG
jgi:hypothetical protein